jgi:RecB family endonuclease NucS
MGQKEEILRTLWEAEMPIKQGEIADRMGRDSSAIWRNLTKKLYQEGIVDYIEQNPRRWKIAVDVDTVEELLQLNDYEYDRKNQNKDSVDSQSLSLEKDVQKHLISELSQLKQGLTIESDRTGTEVPVDSGRIDILAEDSNGEPVIIEIKTGKAKKGVLAQTKAYMADIMSRSSEDVTGIIVAEEFSKKLTKAVSIERSVELYTYKIKFDFETY